MRRAFLLAIVCFVTTIGFGQPTIDKVERISGYPASTVLITGTGFSSTIADLKVWFGNVEATITEASETYIKVTVPPQARYDNVEVTVKSSDPPDLSTKSTRKFIPNFSGVQPFDETKLYLKKFVSANRVFDLCTCDIDDDGDTDIIGTRDATTNLTLLINTSVISADSTELKFTPSTITLPFQTFSVTCGDLNGDGKPEIVASRAGANADQIFILPNNTLLPNTPVWGSLITLPLTPNDKAREIAIRDLNKDGRPEIIVTNAATANIYIFENLMNSTTLDVSKFNKITTPVFGITNSLALDVQDFNKDTYPDIALIQNDNSLNVYILTNLKTLLFTNVTTVPVSGSGNLNDIASADFNNDELMDIVVADRSAERPFVLINARGSGTLGTSYPFSNLSGPFDTSLAHGVDVGDISGDGLVDFVIASRDVTAPEEQLDIYINTGSSFTKERYVPPFDAWFAKVGDYDGDSKPDIAMTMTDNSTNFGIYILKNRNCHQPVILNSTPLTICDGQTIQLETININGVTFSWERNGVPVGTGPTLNITDAASAGSYVVKATGENASPQKCLSIPSTALVVASGAGSAPLPPTITEPADGVCIGTALTLKTNIVGGATYIWSGPNNYSTSTIVESALVTSSATLTEKGDYFLRIKVGNCTSNPSAAKFVDVVSPESFQIGSDVGNAVCSGQTVELNVNTSDYTVQWKDGTTNVSTANPYSFSAVDVPHSYTAVLTHISISGCVSTTDPFVLNVYKSPTAVFEISPTSVCVGTQVTFDATTSDIDNTDPKPSVIKYDWVFGDATSALDGDVDAVHTYSVPFNPRIASLTIRYPGTTGCTSTLTTKQFEVFNATPPTITTIPTPGVTEICGDGSETVTLQVNGSYDTYVWTPAGDPIATYPADAPGTYSVVTTASNGCTGNAEITLTAKPGCDAGAAGIPKVFTPNGSGPAQTETWIITGVPNLDECTMSVFDGRGRRIFEVKGFPATGWDGIANGRPVPDGTYYYVLGCPGAKPVTGSVLIVR